MLRKEEVENILANFKDTKVLLIGDGMIDAYMWGNIHRMSPEAPVPVVSIDKTENRLGGAANVAINLKALEAHPILCGVVGDDEKGELFLDLMRNDGLDTSGIIKLPNRATTIKTRIISDNKHVLRVDEETTEDIPNEVAFIENLKRICLEQKVDVILFQDYNKGVITHKVIEEMVAFAKEHAIPTIVDPKKKNFLNYKNVSLFKPNLKEIKEGLEINFDAKVADELDNSVELLKNKLNADRVMVTLSELGVYISNGTEKKHIPAHSRNIVDVSGAGDTVVSVAALCLAQNVSNEIIAGFANLAGGLVCEEVGVVPINKELLLKEAIKIYT